MIPCAKSEAMLFNTTPTQITIDSARYVDYYPIAKVTENAEFVIKSQNYLDLNDTIVTIKMHVIKNNEGNDLEENDEVSIVNNILSSLFSDITVYVNGKQVENTNGLYPYKSIMTTLLNYNADSANSHLAACGFVSDAAGVMNAKENIGYLKRKKMCANSRKIDLSGPLFLDLFTQSKLILPETEIKLKFTIATKNFILKHALIKGYPKICIDDMTIYVRNVRLSQATVIGHEIGLNSNNALYQIQKTHMKYFNISKGSSSFTQDNLFANNIPKFLVFGMVKNSSFNGNKSENPFNFEHFNVNFVGLYKDGECVPSRELTPDFKNGICTREYISLMSSVGVYGKNIATSISLEEYKNNGYVLFGFNLSPDLDYSAMCKQVNKFGSLRLELRFEEALTASINIVMMAIFDGEIQITKMGNVLL